MLLAAATPGRPCRRRGGSAGHGGASGPSRAPVPLQTGRRWCLKTSVTLRTCQIKARKRPERSRHELRKKRSFAGGRRSLRASPRARPRSRDPSPARRGSPWGTASAVPASEPREGQAEAAATRKAQSGAEVGYPAWCAPSAPAQRVNGARRVTARITQQANHKQHLKRGAHAHHSRSQFPPPRPSARCSLFALRQYLGAHARNRDAIVRGAVGRAENLFSPIYTGTERPQHPVPRKLRTTSPAACLSRCSHPAFIREILVFLMSCLPAGNC